MPKINGNPQIHNPQQIFWLHIWFDFSSCSKLGIAHASVMYIGIQPNRLTTIMHPN